MHRLLIIIATALAHTAPARGPAPVSPYRFQQIYHAHRASVLRIRSHTAQGLRDGSAFLIGDTGLLLTTQHLVQDAQRVELLDDSGQGLLVQLVAQDPELDVALLRAPSAGSLPVLELAPRRRLRKGEWVVGIGRQADGSLVSRAGCVSSVGRQTYVVDAATPAGGVILDLQGQVVALALRPRGARRVVVLGVHAIVPFVKKISLDRRSPSPAGRPRRPPS